MSLSSSVRRAVFVLAVLIGSAAPARADLFFYATLTGGQENPPVPTGASGFATLVLKDAGTELWFEIRTFGLDWGQILPNGLRDTTLPGFTPDTGDNVTAVHFHRGPIGVNGPVVFGFVGAPIHDTNGDTFVDAANGVVRGRWNVGDATSLTANLADLLSGNLYANVHTVRNGGGEIRGQILTPEPATLAVFGAVAAGLVAVRRRRAG